jgi:hypothetical protein
MGTLALPTIQDDCYKKAGKKQDSALEWLAKYVND